jgi:hypothetical protein
VSGQKGSRKVGRNKRKPANAVYLREMRWERNKRLSIQAEAAWQSLCKQARQFAGDGLNGVQRAIRRMKRAQVSP